MLHVDQSEASRTIVTLNLGRAMIRLWGKLADRLAQATADFNGISTWHMHALDSTWLQGHSGITSRASGLKPVEPCCLLLPLAAVGGLACRHLPTSYTPTSRISATRAALPPQPTSLRLSAPFWRHERAVGLADPGLVSPGPRNSVQPCRAGQRCQNYHIDAEIAPASSAAVAARGERAAAAWSRHIAEGFLGAKQRCGPPQIKGGHWRGDHRRGPTHA